MDARISSALAARLRALALASPDREICGLLVEDGGGIAAIETANVATDAAAAFEIDPAALLRAHRAERTGGARIVGHYHSHPQGDAIPSARDAAAAAPDGRLWIILARGTIRAWRYGVTGFREVALTVEA